MGMETVIAEKEMGVAEMETGMWEKATKAAEVETEVAKKETVAAETEAAAADVPACIQRTDSNWKSRTWLPTAGCCQRTTTGTRRWAAGA